MNVIDLIAPTLPALLNRSTARTTMPPGITLHTRDAEIVDDAARAS